MELICKDDILNEIGDLFTICSESPTNEHGKHYVTEDELRVFLNKVKGLQTFKGPTKERRCGKCVYSGSCLGIDYDQTCKKYRKDNYQVGPYYG